MRINFPDEPLKIIDRLDTAIAHGKAFSYTAIETSGYSSIVVLVGEKPVTLMVSIDCTSIAMVKIFEDATYDVSEAITNADNINLNRAKRENIDRTVQLFTNVNNIEGNLVWSGIAYNNGIAHTTMVLAPLSSYTIELSAPKSGIMGIDIKWIEP